MAHWLCTCELGSGQGWVAEVRWEQDRYRKSSWQVPFGRGEVGKGPWWQQVQMGQRPLVLMDGSSCHHGLDQREGAGVGGGRGQPGVPCLLGLHPSPFLPAVQHLAVCQCFLWCSLTAATKVMMGGSGLESDLTKVAVTNAEGGQSLTSACDFSSTYPPGASLRSCPYLLCAKYFQIQPGSHHPEASLYSGFLAMTPNSLVELAGIMTLQPLSSCFLLLLS